MLKHGQARRGKLTRLYRAWYMMHARCKKNYPKHKYYYDRGIRVCTRWDDFLLFAKDMGPHPGEGWTLDREKNDKGYSFANCRWATRKMQMRNSRRALIDEAIAAEIRGRHVPYARPPHKGSSSVLAAEFGVSQQSVRGIIRRDYWT